MKFVTKGCVVLRSYTALVRQSESWASTQPVDGITLSLELIEEFLSALRQSGRAEETPKAYRQKLKQLYQYLPDDKCIRAGTLDQWMDDLQGQGYSTSTINSCISAANGLVNYCGHRELQAERQLRQERGVQPELTRKEYLRLLSAARMLDREREYLLVKLFGSTGLNLQDLSCVTVEAVLAGQAPLPNSVLWFPNCLREELLDYIRRKGIASGPVFLTRKGTLLRRTNITKMIQALGREAQVDMEKASPRCLRKLYQATQAGIHADIARLAEQTYERMLETEQLVIGWKQGEEAGR